MIFLSFYLINILIIILSCHFILEVDCQASGRNVPGCALINDHIYCYGGFAGSSNNNGIDFTGELNENLELDLTVFGDFSIFDKSKVKWNFNPKSINGSVLPSAGQAATTSLSDGTILFYGGRGATPNSMPFIHFDPKTSTWNNISVPNNTYL